MSNETMQDFLDDIHAKLTPPEHHQAVQLATEARQKLTQLYTQPTGTPEDLHPFQSGAVTDNWLEAVLQEKAEQARIEATSAVLKSFINAADNRAQGATPNDAELLRAYHKRLAELLDDVVEVVEQLNGATTADQAITNDRAAQWSRLLQLTGDHDTLRRAQRALLDNEVINNARPAVQGGDYEHVNDLTVRNLDDIWPQWRQPHLTPGQITDPWTGRVNRLEPWPEDRVQLLIWMATSKAEPWIPTKSQLQSLSTSRRRAMGTIPQRNKTTISAPRTAVVITSGG